MNYRRTTEKEAMATEREKKSEKKGREGKNHVDNRRTIEEDAMATENEDATAGSAAAAVGAAGAGLSEAA